MNANNGMVDLFSLIFLFFVTGIVIGTCFREAFLKVVSWTLADYIQICCTSLLEPIHNSPL